MLIILIEQEGYQSIEDVFLENPRKHEVMAALRTERRRGAVASSKAVDGNQLYKSLCTIRDRYNVRFEFCEKNDTGKKIIELLSKRHE
ncbi:hypothetical protein [Hungatella sp.]|uniref:hypothetical protein n=1 Tax=Hungatella sp. TaxID=2613924 RepID=UPI0039939A6A